MADVHGGRYTALLKKEQTGGGCDGLVAVWGAGEHRPHDLATPMRRAGTRPVRRQDCEKLSDSRAWT